MSFPQIPGFNLMLNQTEDRSVARSAAIVVGVGFLYSFAVALPYLSSLVDGYFVPGFLRIWVFVSLVVLVCAVVVSFVRKHPMTCSILTAALSGFIGTLILAASFPYMEIEQIGDMVQRNAPLSPIVGVHGMDLSWMGIFGTLWFYAGAGAIYCIARGMVAGGADGWSPSFKHYLVAAIVCLPLIVQFGFALFAPDRLVPV